ncbi:MAG: hypothetical protein GX595_09645, partial [Lentisphaerae bacterium]|nr:hypothetical protein [Lentisphaerota bacterium]
DRVCQDLFRQWSPLLRQAQQVSVLLWAADGSEILEYGGRLEEPFEWACWQGVANPARPYRGDHPETASIHDLPRPYMAAPPVFTYGWLKDLTAALKRIGTAATGLPVRVGATFDPGPEFARSDFKYRRHREICMGDTMGQGTMVCCYATLNADDRPYAGFPKGIPQGTPFGTFLGRQSKHFLADLGFDYLWLSNGFGFGLETWGLKGAVFDGSRFASDRCSEVREKSLRFWRTFRAECPDVPLETRGTNLSTGMDLSSDAVPWQDIYREVTALMPPPNSPWAALNGDFGLELVGWMSHIAAAPGERFPFRYYIHDPWFLNSPWLDRYQREPHDIVLPLTVSRLDGDGRVECPTELEFLTVDDSWGAMPDQVPNEVTPHILAARAMAPDAPGPLVWAYPFDEYHAMTFGPGDRLGEVFFGDWFLRGAVNQGLPLNTVVSTANAVAILARRPEALSASIVVTPVPDADSPWDHALRGWLERGGRVMFYGPLRHASAFWLDTFGVDLREPVEGDLEIEPDGSSDAPDGCRTLRHHALLSAGPLQETPRDGRNPPGLRTARQGTARRAVTALATWPGGGMAAWVRGTVSCDPTRMGGHLLVPYDARDAFPAEGLMRRMLRHTGWEILPLQRRPGQPVPLLCLARHAQGLIIAGYSPDTTCALALRTPLGAPVPSGWDAWMEDGKAVFQPPRAWLRECRVFVDQAAAGTVSCRISRSGFPTVRRRLEVDGLQRATVRFLPEPGTADRVVVTHQAPVPCLNAPRLATRLEDGPLGPCLVIAEVSGQIMISW